MLIGLLSLGMAAYAGGGHDEWRVTAFSQEGALTRFSLRSTDAATAPPYGCEELTVEVAYALVPAYAWLPFVETTHPTREETLQSLSLIEATYRARQTLLFGVMGSGLAATPAPCVFQSRGLDRVLLDGHTVIFSFFHPV